MVTGKGHRHKRDCKREKEEDRETGVLSVLGKRFGKRKSVKQEQTKTWLQGTIKWLFDSDRGKRGS